MKHYILVNRKVVRAKAGTSWSNKDRIVAQTDLNKDCFVSTVFLGIDHAFDGGPPLLFETLVFGGPFDGLMKRCSTWEQAETQHQLMLERVKKCSQK